MANTTTLEIHPAIGIARVGSSALFFPGPEPGVSTETNRRDSSPDKLLKRQAAVFRVFSCTRDSQGAIVDFEEITSTKGTIAWTVHLANRKAAAPKFRDNNGLPNTQSTPRRNNATGNDATDKDLIIDGGQQTLTGASQLKLTFQGSFRSHPVPLGEMSTDADGRLVVVGGFGVSRSFPASTIGEFADNNNWHDDTSDGPVSATVHFLDGRANPDQVVDKAAWVIACQPDFAPAINNLVTLYDAMIEQAIGRGVLPMPTFKPAYDLDVFPLLERVLAYQWVNKYNRDAHGPGGNGDFNTLSGLDDPTGPNFDRQAVFKLLRDPDAPAAPAPLKAMPALFSDDYFADPTRRLAQILSRPQYRILKEWASGNFTAPPPPGTPSPPAPKNTPDDYTRVTLEACVGASFCPGIEAGRKIRDPSIYVANEVFRFDHTKLKAGELTQSMALPWQADFLDCTWEDPAVGPKNKGRGWWPAQRPDHVLLAPDDQSAAMVDWARGAQSFTLMVQNWHKLGVVLETKDSSGQPAFVETQRTL